MVWFLLWRRRAEKNQGPNAERSGVELRPLMWSLAAKGRTNVKKAMICLVVTGTLGLGTAPIFAQTGGSSTTTAKASSVSRTTKAVNFRRAGGSTKLEFHG